MLRALADSQKHAPHVGTFERVLVGTFGGLFETFYPKLSIDSTDLAKVAVDLAVGQDSWSKRDEKGVMENLVIRELAKQSIQ